MKKSDQYYEAMKVVLKTPDLQSHHKLEILETLMQDRKMARYAEEPNSEATVE